MLKEFIHNHSKFTAQRIKIAYEITPYIEQTYNLFWVIRISQANFRAIYNQISIHCFDFNSDQTCSSIIKFLFKLELLIILGLSIGYSIYSVFTSPKSLKLYFNKHIDIFQYAYILYNNGNVKQLIENNELIYKQLKTHSTDLSQLDKFSSKQYLFFSNKDGKLTDLTKNLIENCDMTIDQLNNLNSDELCKVRQHKDDINKGRTLIELTSESALDNNLFHRRQPNESTIVLSPISRLSDT